MNTNQRYVAVPNAQAVSGRTQVVAKFPAPKPTVVVVPEQKCRKNCCPVLSRGCDTVGNSCGDYYLHPICDSVGITGMLTARPCIMFDENYGGISPCIGCEKDCGNIDLCPRYY